MAFQSREFIPINESSIWICIGHKSLEQGNFFFHSPAWKVNYQISMLILREFTVEITHTLVLKMAAIQFFGHVSDVELQNALVCQNEISSALAHVEPIIYWSLSFHVSPAINERKRISLVKEFIGPIGALDKKVPSVDDSTLPVFKWI